MIKTLLMICFCFIGGFIFGQCPDGPRPKFWHPDQIDSFKLAYPNCDKFSFQTTMINGEYVKPTTNPNPINLPYLFTLAVILLAILRLLKLITIKIPYFR